MAIVETTPRGAVDVFGRLGIEPFINASGTVTVLGGTVMAPEILEAMTEASHSYVDLPLLLERAGRYLAERIGVPGAFISSGAAGGIAVATAAVLSGGDPERAWALPRTDGRPNEIVAYNAEYPSYIHQAAAMVGGKLVEVGGPDGVTVDDFANAIGPQTAAVLYVYAHVELTLAKAGARAATLSAVARAAHARGVPVIVDAASELPPREKLVRFHREGGDLVVFSGGKGIYGPQSTGLVVGRADLIKACLLNGAPSSSVGRGMKVGKEEIAGFVRAVEIFLESDEVALFAEWKRRAQVVADRLQGIPGVEARVLENDGRNRPPECAACFITITDSSLGSPAEIAAKLAKGKPAIRVRHLPDGFFVCPMTLQPGEEVVVGEQLRMVLRNE
jgi:L-seryl-tRNA(Ser) seleniumtransferase